MLTNTLESIQYMEPVDINRLAIDRLNAVLHYCSINLVAKYTRVTRSTLYRWLDADIELEKMNHQSALWFLVHYETSPAIALILQRQGSNRYMAHFTAKEAQPE